VTEFNPFGPPTEADTEARAAQPGPQNEESGSSKTLVIALGAIAGVALAAGAFLFVGGGDDSDELAPVARAPRAAAPATASPAPKLPAPANLTLGRNPFRALYVEPVAVAEAPAGGVTTPTDPTDGGTSVILVPAADSGTGAPAPGTAQPAPAPAPAPAVQSTVRLLSVDSGKEDGNPVATFDYDGAKVSGGVGDVMAGKLLLLSLQRDHTGSWFVNLQLGDGDPFEVHERQTVVVQ
jgi:hypothetical protein